MPRWRWHGKKLREQQQTSGSRLAGADDDDDKTLPIVAHITLNYRFLDEYQLPFFL
jgi:hypothetical protein